MATVSALDIPPELEALFRELVRLINQWNYGATGLNGHLPSREQKRKVSQRSLLPEIAAIWSGLSEEQKAAWKAAAKQSNYNAWNLFVQDMAYRLKFGIDGVATPSTYHQYKVGRIEIAAPAHTVLLAQYHPPSYWVSKKVKGTKDLWTDVEITEKLGLPLELGLSYRADLTIAGASPHCRFYARILSSYQGRDIETDVGFEIPFKTDWARQTTEVFNVIGIARSYNLYIDIQHLRGWFEFDNVLAKHHGTNFARDFRCTDVNNELDRANWQIEKSWEEEILPTGSAYDSVYPDD